MTNILLVTNIFPPQIGGPAMFIDRLAHALHSAGHRVTVVCSSSEKRVADDSGRPYRLRRVTGRNSVEFQARLAAILPFEALRHDRILVNGLEFPAYLAARLTGRRYVLKIVGDTVWETARNVGSTALSIDEFQNATLSDAYLQSIAHRRRLYLGRAEAIITPSQYLRRMVIGWGVAPERVHTIFNGVPLAPGTALSTSAEKADPLEVAFVGRLTNWKGVETLLLALSRITGVRAHIFGDGPELPMLTGLSNQMGLGDRSVFHGRVIGEALHRRLACVHALVLTSAYEGLSHTLLEACALGLPCIASACGGNTEIIRDNENGLLVPYGDVAALEEALKRLKDDALRVRLGFNARQTVEKFDFKQTVDQTFDILTAKGERPHGGGGKG